MKRTLLATALLLIFLSCAYFQFHDGPPPDLSRFSRPEHDPAAFAQVKKLTDEIRANSKEYKLVDLGDPDPDTLDETQDLDKLALQRDPNALRALRRHLKENETALTASHKLIALEKIAFEPLVPGNAFVTGSDTIVGIKIAIRLIRYETILAGVEERTAPAWDTLADGLRFVRRSEKAQHMLITGLTLLAVESIDLNAANDLAAFEKSPGHIRKFLTVMDENRPDPLQFKASFAGECLAFADSVLPSRGGKINLRDRSVFGFGTSKPAGISDWLKNAPENTRAGWLELNTLPNDTVYEYGQILDRELTVSTPTPSTSPSRAKWGLWLLTKNSGGTQILDMTTGAILPMVRRKYFQNATRHDLTRLALAIRVYQLTHDGNRPATLAALAPDILPAIPTDSFAGGAPLRYDAASGKVWSVGEDGKDDGGDPEDNKDIVVAPPVLTPPPATP